MSWNPPLDHVSSVEAYHRELENEPEFVMGTDTITDLTAPGPAEEDVQRALHAADAGEAGHWPMVASVLAYEVRALRARVAELEAGETRTEWNARWTVDNGRELLPEYEEDGVDVGEVVARRVATLYRARGVELVRREVREYVGPWVPVEDEAGE